MAVTLYTPGVYFEWIEAPARPRLARLDGAGFVGIAERGPLGRPVEISSFVEYRSVFGGYLPHAYLTYAVDGFFRNRGARCWVVRVDDEAAATTAHANMTVAGRTFSISASSAGAWGNHIGVRAFRRGINWDLQLRLREGEEFVIRGFKPALPGEEEPPLPALPDVDGFPVRLGEALPGGRWIVTPGEGGQLSGGRDGLSSLNVDHFLGRDATTDAPGGLRALLQVRDAAMIGLPDLVPPPEPPAPPPPLPKDCRLLQAEEARASTRAAFVSRRAPSLPELIAVQTTAMTLCALERDRVAYLDMPTALRWESMSRDYLSKIRTGDNSVDSYGAAFGPWLLADDPLALNGPVRLVPPCGHVAGATARVERTFGLHQPPGNEILEGIRDVQYVIPPEWHGVWNDAGGNAVRVSAGRGIRLYGSRTLSRDPRTLFLNVRRLLIGIRRGLLDACSWIPFEPNSTFLWRDLERSVRGFLAGLFEEGLLDGATADEAFRVQCDEGTNPAFDVDAGRLQCQIEVRLPRPAEFVRIVIEKTQEGTEVIEERNDRDG